ncbi:MAG: hypothetical protein ACR2HQ_00750 [Ilumatobacteraceae bacterium]
MAYDHASLIAPVAPLPKLEAGGETGRGRLRLLVSRPERFVEE